MRKLNPTTEERINAAQLVADVASKKMEDAKTLDDQTYLNGTIIRAKEKIKRLKIK